METTQEMQRASRATRPRQGLSLVGQTVLFVQVLVLLASLTGAAYFAQTYLSENDALVSQIDEVAATTGRSVTAAEDLIFLSHQVSVLDTSISSAQSFLQPFSDTTSTGGWCGNYVRVFMEYARAKGYPTHMVHLRTGTRSHTAAEILYQGEWRIVDPFFGRVFPLSGGELATFQDLAGDTSLAAGTSVVPDIDPELEDVYSYYQTFYGELYRDALDFQWDLSPNALYHDGIIVLSYPMSLLSEGPRRPIVPYWLYRPELLGIYLSGGVFLVTLVLLIRTGLTSRRPKL